MARLGAGLVLLFGFALAHADVAVPPLTSRVTDLTGTLSGGAVARIESKLAALDKKISVVNGEPLPEPDKKWERHGGLGNMLPLLLIVVFVASGVLRALFGRLFGSLATGGLAGGIVWLLSHLIPIGIGAGFVAFL